MILDSAVEIGVAERNPSTVTTKGLCLEVGNDRWCFAIFPRMKASWAPKAEKDFATVRLGVFTTPGLQLAQQPPQRHLWNPG